ncbi:MAG: hypothetical protein H7124_03385, partial [Phycisphaerales bacterium]|nr:hypothetical protein [Hyphomonadaceae bacterium]
ESGGSAAGGEAGEEGVTAPPASEAPASATGGEAGEAGAATAYAGLSGDQLTALRLQHLKGFVMAAAAVTAENQPNEAGILVQQGLLEVYDVAPDQFGTLNVAIIRAAGEGDTLNRAQRMQRIRTAEDELNRAAAELEADPAITVARMVDVATGLYSEVVQPDFVDPIEYQHSMGAALAARDALIRAESQLRRANIPAYSEARGALNSFVALWPDAAAPERPTPYRDVLAQGSRVRLALSPFL